MVEYLGLADFLLIAEAVLEIPAEVLAMSSRLYLADSALNAPATSYAGVELYPSLHQKAAILCARICNNHPLLDGNKRVGYECMREFVSRNGVTWINPIDDSPNGDETVKVMWMLAAGQLSETEFVEWVALRVGSDDIDTR
jgi:death-on-curing protein